MNEQMKHLLAHSDTPHYNIKAVVQQTQVNISTLRAWEQRYGIPHPNRSDHGHRLYSERDIATIKWLKQCTDKGLAISQAVALLRDQRDDEVREQHHALAAPRAEGSWVEIRAQLMDALADVDLRQAHLLFNMVSTLFSVETLIHELIQPVLMEVGERWANGEMCVAEERVATNFIRQRLMVLLQVHAPFANGPRLICGCAPDENHEIGLLSFGLLMEQRGWEVIYVGQTMVTEGLATFINRLAPALVCVSVSMVEHLPGLLDISHTISTQCPDQIIFAYGGRVFDTYPEFQQRVGGIFLGNDLREAVERAVRLGEQLNQGHWLHASPVNYYSNGLAQLATSAARAR